MKKETPKTPPATWHKDAKWITGILASFTVGLMLLLLSLNTLTSPKHAIPISAEVVASLFSPKGLDDDSDFKQVIRQMQQTKQDKFYPLGTKEIYLTKADIQNSTPRELRLKIFSQVVEPIYYGDTAKLASLGAKDGDTKAQLGALQILTKQSHDSLKMPLYITVGASIILLGLLAYFSFGFGRLASPGVVLSIASLPGALLSAILGITIEQGKTPGQDLERAGNAIKETLPDIVTIFANVYTLALEIGLSLLLIAALGKLIQKLRHHKK